jgi:NADH dehydrogenase
VILIEGSDNLLNAFSEPLREYTKQVLAQKGVEVMLSVRVTDVDEGGVTIQSMDNGSSSQRIDSANVIWAAGVNGNPLGGKLLEKIGQKPRKDGRVEVEPDLTIPGLSQIYVVGDLAAAKDARRGGEVPGVATGAMQMGSYAGRSIALRLRGKARDSIKSFAYRDKGSMATIGRARAVAEVGSLKLKGLPAWLAWGALHIRYLVGFRNRIVTLFSWMMTYLFYTKGSRLITDNVAMSNSLPVGIGVKKDSNDASDSPDA